jgi:hypothetical protein
MGKKSFLLLLFIIVFALESQAQSLQFVARNFLDEQNGAGHIGVGVNM